MRGCAPGSTTRQPSSPDWKSVAEAPIEEVEEAIRPGGISTRQVAAHPGHARSDRRESAAPWTSSPLATAPREEAIEFLERLPGVGRKTAACVLLFSFDRPELPVDTHVYRVVFAAWIDQAEGVVRGGS